MGDKFRYLFSNMGWMTISNFASKILVFCLVPLYTRALASEGYGLYDLGYTAVVLLVPLLTFNVGESLMRFAIKKKERQGEFFSTALLVSVLSSCLVLICTEGLICFWDFEINMVQCFRGASWLFVSYSIYTLFFQFARGIERLKVMAFGGLINTALTLLLSCLLLWIDATIMSCFVAISVASFVGGVFIAVNIGFWRYLCRPTLVSFMEMLKYGIPLSVNSMGWWVNSSFSRYATALLCGVSSAGLLAAAYKVPSIPKAVQQIFVQSWQISSIKEYDPNDTDGFFGRVYDAVCSVSAIMTSTMIALSPALAMLMFSPDYFEAWIYIPVLMLCVLFDGLASVVGGIFSAAGDTRPIATSAAISVVVTIAISFLLIPNFGIQGAAVSSAISSFLIWILRLRQSKRYMNFSRNSRLTGLIISLLLMQTALAVGTPLGIVWSMLQIVILFVLVFLSLRNDDIRKMMKKALLKKHSERAQKRR